MDYNRPHTCPNCDWSSMSSRIQYRGEAASLLSRGAATVCSPGRSDTRNTGGRRTPLLGKGGVAAHIKKRRRSLLSGRSAKREPDRAKHQERGGSLSHRLSEVKRTTPAAPFKGTRPFI